MTDRRETLNYVLSGLMRRYQERVPDVQSVIDDMVKGGLIGQAEDIENDHIAFRTMGVPQLGIQSFEKIFLHYGYQRREPYDFAAKKLNAYWYSPPDPLPGQPNFPRIFVSELRVGDLSEEAQRIITSYTDEVPSDPVDDLNLDDGVQVDEFLHRALWRLPSWEDYQRLQEESEYAAWVIYNRYYLNHFTVSVHNLPEGYDTIEQFNAFLEGHGYTLNSSGGKAKTSPDGLLIQSSTVAEMIDAEFAGGHLERISGSYVEFAERRPLPEFADLPKNELTRDKRREGFEAGNADKIFESTYSSQTAGR
ncbi:DUF1338 domain-containing protein [Deinococcus radiophilus]|uniref:2-oxoadipate dioxygenase/decarboxylase n=1 Tax=Deinococcus radiophilus TaxID=32062 RepID=A0A3S0INH1_9DEIO|nr:DUF1338 domain-containing protein [Deinococcus radiophilus]RTR28007.1 DUF1338 domain-containing protein [Deinococcus radiophilus]UFA51544.1 DUF1338 domain-containing protein [Deinococcus radiophilus]